MFSGICWPSDVFMGPLCLFREDSCPNQSFVLGFLGLQEYDLQWCAKPPSSLSASCRLWAMPTLFEFAKINILTKTPMLQKDRWQYSPKTCIISLEQFTRPSPLGKSVEIHRRGRRNMFIFFYMLCFLSLLLDVFRYGELCYLRMSLPLFEVLDCAAKASNENQVKG